MARLDMASFLRGLAIGLGLQPGASRRGDREAEAYQAGLKGRSHETGQMSMLPGIMRRAKVCFSCKRPKRTRKRQTYHYCFTCWEGVKRQEGIE